MSLLTQVAEGDVQERDRFREELDEKKAMLEHLEATKREGINAQALKMEEPNELSACILGLCPVRVSIHEQMSNAYS